MKPSSRSTVRNQQTDADLESGSVTPPRRARVPDVVSPADTFDTAAITCTSPTSEKSPPPQKVTIQHNVKSNGGTRSPTLAMIMVRPLMGLLMLIAMGAAVAAVLGWIRIPGLSTQIQKLEAEVGRLNEEVSRLSNEVDRLEGENDRFAYLNNQLNETVLEFEELSLDLNYSVGELEVQVDVLSEENLNYAQLNRDLNSTAAQLAAEVDFFQTAMAELLIENEVLSNLTEALEGLTDQLGNLTTVQNETLIELQSTLTLFMEENDRLEDLNADMMAVVGFMNETAIGLGATLQQVTDSLAEEVERNMVITLGGRESFYRGKRTAWDCDYRDEFREQGFGADFSLEIANLAPVLDYVDGRLLSELCFSVSDFENYLRAQYPDRVTSFRLIAAVNDYTLAGIDFYFPEVARGEVGVSPQEWADASYRCKDLQRSFSWRQSQ